MHIRLEGKLALVTGSTAGIGFSIARALAGTGARVIVNGRTEARVTSAIDQLKKDVPNGEFVPCAADLSDAKEANAVAKAYPNVDVLVNNLGIFEPRDFFEIEDADWERFFSVNVLSGVRLSRLYAQGMATRGWGRIVFISSESGLQIPVEMIHYGTTKTAQIAVARGLAERLAGTGVTVNSVLPGPTRSEGVGGFIKALAEGQGKPEAEVEAEFIKLARPTSLIQRFATTDEVASMIVYVCSEQASATTGSALRVDGGVVRAIP
jgi:NAD(P)-dependent dehydrogenase (short-subunit alcohol dehydrogenase family)